VTLEWVEGNDAIAKGLYRGAKYEVRRKVKKKRGNVIGRNKKRKGGPWSVG
jgi:hypothetical protein